MTASASNGSVYIVAYWPGEDGLEPQVIALRAEPEGFKLLIAIVVVSANAEAAYMRITPMGEHRVLTLN
jgi:hypothetical protein